MAEPTISFEAEIGLLYFSYIRDLVGELAFRGYNINYWEGRGRLSKKFVFRGDPIAIRAVNQHLEKIAKHNASLDAITKGS